MTPDDIDDDYDAAPPGRPCAKPGCLKTIPASAHHFQKYCDTHKPKPRRKGAGAAPPPTADELPGSAGGGTVINLGTQAPAKGTAQLDAVEARVKQALNMMALGVTMIGNAEDAADIAKGSTLLAAQMKVLAQYEPWLKKLATTGGGTPDRALAWLAVIMALACILVPILDRHGAIPKQLTPVLMGLIDQQAAPPPIIDPTPDGGAPAAPDPMQDAASASEFPFAA